jgi:cardiolipin synthase
VDEAFAETWAEVGPPLDERDIAPHPPPPVGDVDLRVVASVPNTAGVFRVDQLVAAMARHTLWLTDAYYAGTTPYVQALLAAARDGVDVRLLVPGASDIPALRPFSRAGYRPLLEGGVRVFEWNGTMLHAKTAVADGRWARVGSTNLNLASWIGNRELDVLVEHEPFARDMEAMFEDDLANATEVVLDLRKRLRAPGRPRRRRPRRATAGSGGRVMSGAARIGSTVSAAITNRRVLEAVESHIALTSGALLAVLAAVAVRYPRGIAYPVALLAAWFAVALLYRGIAVRRK